MLDDNQIKVETSLFAVRVGKIKKFDGKDGYVSMNTIIYKIDLGLIIEQGFL